MITVAKGADSLIFSGWKTPETQRVLARMSKKVSQSNITGWKTPETRRVLARKLSAGCKLERIVIHELADHLQNVAAMDQSQYVIFWRLPI